MNEEDRRLLGGIYSIRQRNHLLISCATTEAYQSSAFFQALCREQPTEIRYYSGKKAKQIHHAYEKAYEDVSTYEPCREQGIDVGTKGTDYHSRSFHMISGGSCCHGRMHWETGTPMPITAWDNQKRARHRRAAKPFINMMQKEISYQKSMGKESGNFCLPMTDWEEF